MTYWRIKGGKKHHRDPGCRAFDRFTAASFNAAVEDGRIEEFEGEPVETERCTYCWSKAGARRLARKGVA